MLQQGELYKHISMLDIQIYISTPGIKHQGKTVYGVKYYNPAYKAFQPSLTSTDGIVIKDEDEYKWQKVSTK